MNDWPTSNDYTIAIQTPQLCFRDPDLKEASVGRTKATAMPRVWTGNFAQVYELTGATDRWAVKCFTRSAVDIRRRYSEIAEGIARSRLPYFVDFKFLDDEMLVNGTRYPVVKMHWVEGQSLDGFVESNLHRPSVLLKTASRLLDIVTDLERQQLAHGDLQHGNIVITRSGIKLVDYDGLFVPAFSGTPAPETGLPSYQHPDRSPADYGVGLDRFSLLVICTGLAALASDPGLWHEFNTGDNLLFTHDDFRAPATSRLIQRLKALGDRQVEALVEQLTAACGGRPLAVPLLCQQISFDAQPRHGFWWIDVEKRRRRTTDDQEAAQDGGDTSGIAPFKRLILAALMLVVVGGSLAATPAGPRAGFFMAAGVALAYALARLARYVWLPVVRRQRQLRSLERRLSAAIADELRRRDKAKDRLAWVDAEEQRERGQELARWRALHVATGLASMDVGQLGAAETVGRSTVEKLRRAGVHDLLQLKERGWTGTRVGLARRRLGEAQLSAWERRAAKTTPDTLLPEVDTLIARKYLHRRQILTDEIGSRTARIATMSSDLHQAEWDLEQLRVPRLGQYLKHAL